MKTNFPFLMAFVIGTSLLVCSSTISAQAIKQRLNQKAILEPDNKIINGAGQDETAFTNYWNVMHANDKPVVYMWYVGLKDATSDWSEGLKASLMAHPGKFLVPQIGLSMTTDGTATSHYEQDVAAGLYDLQISRFIDGLQSLAIPAFLRIGYEFNGTAWNGYAAGTYIQAYQRITDMIRDRGLEVATVWDYSTDGVTNFMDFYPGDDYVDWWGINIFSANYFTDAFTVNFMNGASEHEKPVMIGETTPRYVGVLNGQQSWNDWFSPFFTFIHNYPEVKCFSYIDWNWSNYAQWSTWGDGRLEQNTTVANAFGNEMDSVAYLHASSESNFRKTFGLADNIAPAAPGTITVAQSGYPLKLNWNTVSDLSGLSHYIVYKHGVLNDYTLTLPYSDNKIFAGDTITYSVSAMDRAGNESTKTQGLKVTIPSSIDKELNGEFDKGTSNWTFTSYSAGAAGTMSIDSSSVLSGEKSCLADISAISGTDWHLQLWQWLPVKANLKYKITFRAKASAAKNIVVCIQQGTSPYTVYYNHTHALTTTEQTFTDSFTMNASDQAKLEFFLGTPGAVKIWIDSVSIIETNTAVPTSVDNLKTDAGVFNIFPNPAGAVTTLQYTLPVVSSVKVTVFDMFGRQVAVLVNEKQGAGTYDTRFDISDLPNGKYICRLETGHRVQTRSMVVLK